MMMALNIREAQSKLPHLIDEAITHHEKITISGLRGNAVLISESDWLEVSRYYVPISHGAAFLQPLTLSQSSVLDDKDFDCYW